MISNKSTGAEEAVAIISFGDLKYCRGVASILYPHAEYNPRSAMIRNEMMDTKIKVYILMILVIGKFVAIDFIKNNKKGRIQM